MCVVAAAVVAVVVGGVSCCCCVVVVAVTDVVAAVAAADMALAVAAAAAAAAGVRVPLLAPHGPRPLALTWILCTSIIQSFYLVKEANKFHILPFCCRGLWGPLETLLCLGKMFIPRFKALLLAVLRPLAPQTTASLVPERSEHPILFRKCNAKHLLRNLHTRS